MTACYSALKLTYFLNELKSISLSVSWWPKVPHKETLGVSNLALHLRPSLRSEFGELDWQVSGRKSPEASKHSKVKVTWWQRPRTRLEHIALRSWTVHKLTQRP